jgi:hypothetical protein
LPRRGSAHKSHRRLRPQPGDDAHARSVQDPGLSPTSDAKAREADVAGPAWPGAARTVAESSINYTPECCAFSQRANPTARRSS